MNELQSKTVVVTGATSGIGYATAQTLLAMGATVVVTGRSAESADAAVASLRASTKSEKCLVALGDLSTVQGIATLAEQIQKKVERIDVLVHNAGLMASRREFTSDGIESGFAVNVLAPIRLTDKLFSLLQSSPSARIVAVTGGSHPSKLRFDNLQGELEFVGLSQYSHHKLVMMGVMRELAARLQPHGTTVNVCYPGQAVTRMTKSVEARDLPVLMRVVWPLFRWMMNRDDGGRSAQHASRSTVYLATSPTLDGVTGRYVDSKSKDVKWPEAIRSDAVCARLWNVVQELSPTTSILPIH